MNEEAVMITSLDAVVEAALAKYDVSSDATVTLVNVSENTTYRVDDPKTGLCAALRVSRPNYHSETAIESEILWMDALRQARVVNPPRAIAARDGSRVKTVQVEGGGPARHVALFEWLPGSPPSIEKDLVPSFEVLGALAAKMHKHGSAWEPPKGFERYTCDYDTALGPNAMWGCWQDGQGIGELEKGILTRVDTEIQRRLAEYGKGRDRFGLAHNDLRLANLLIDGEDLHVIDFDDCGYAWYMYDFATAVSFIEDDPRVPDWMAAWLEGYKRHRSLSEADLEIIPTLVMLRRLLLVGWVGSHYEYAKEAQELGANYTNVACKLAEKYLADEFLR